METHEQKHTMESIYNEVHEIHEYFPLCGVEAIQKSLWTSHGICAPW